MYRFSSNPELSNFTESVIVVARSDLVALIIGGNYRSASVVVPLVVNASSSYDPDSPRMDQISRLSRLTFELRRSCPAFFFLELHTVKWRNVYRCIK